MTSIENKKECELRDRLSVISTSIYLLMHAKDENERLNRYNTVQEQINAIITIIDEQHGSKTAVFR